MQNWLIMDEKDKNIVIILISFKIPPIHKPKLLLTPNELLGLMMT